MEKPYQLAQDLEKSIKTIAKGAGIIFVGLIAGHLFGTINQILLGRFLGVKNYGYFNLAMSIIIIAKALSVFGLSAGISRFIPFFLEKGQIKSARNTIRFGLKFALFTSICLAIIIYIFSGKITDNFFHEKTLDPVLKFFIIGLPLIVISGILEAVIRALKALKSKVTIYDIGMKMVRISIFIPFILIGYELYGAIIAYLSAMIFTIITSIIIIRKALFPFYPRYEKASIGKKLLSFSWPLGLTGMTFIFISKTDVILLGHYLTSKDIGIYMPALVIAQLLTFVSTSFEYIFLPVISELFAKESKKELLSVFKSVSKWMLTIITPILLYILLFPKEIISLLYGTEYSKGYPALVILAFGVSIGAATSLAGNILVGGGYTKMNLVSEILAAVTNVSLNIILIPIYGIIGAAIGTAGSYFIRSLSFLTLTYRTTKMHPFNKDYIKILLAAIGVIGINYIIKVYVFSNLNWLILMIILGFFLLFAYAGLLLPTHFLDENDKIVLEAIEKKTGFKFNFIRKFF